MALPTFLVKDRNNADQTLNTLASGRQAAADSAAQVWSNEDLAAINAITTALGTIDGRVDSLESLIGVTNSTLTQIDGRVDTLETLIAATNTALGTLNSQTDTLETLIAATNTALGTIDGRVDTLETLIASTNTKLDSLITAAGTEIAAGDEIIGQTVGIEKTGVQIEVMGTVLTVKYASISAASSGDNTIVTGVSGKKIRMLSCALMAEGTVAVAFRSNTAGSNISGAFPLIANTGFVLPHNPHGWCQVSTDAHHFVLNLSAAVGVRGFMTYVEVE